MKHVSATTTEAPREGKRLKERINFTQWILFVCNLLATLVLIGALLLLYAWPERMAKFHLNEQMTQMLAMNLVSLLLLLAWLQRNVSGAWRPLTLAAAFIVLAESWLVGLT